MCSDEGARRRLNPPKPLLPHEEPDDPDWPYAHGNLDPLGKFIGFAVMVVCFSLTAYFRYRQYLRDIVITPLDVAPIIAANASLPFVNPDRFWGTYRPHTYFGLKTRSARSPVFGFMWLTQFTGQMPPSVRHWCEDSDGLLGYSWLKHDGQSFGVQELQEKAYTVRTEFVKRAGGEHGGDWTSRITVTPKNTTQGEVVVSGLFYVALNGQGSVQPVLSHDVLTEIIVASEELGSFKLKFPKAATEKQKSSYLISYAPSLVNLTDIVKSSMHRKAWDDANTTHYMSLGGRVVPRHALGVNFIVKEVTATLPLQMEAVFESDSNDNRQEPLQGAVFDTALNSHKESFDKKFSGIFQLEKKGYTEREANVAKAALSNVLGSVGFFHGTALVQSRYNEEPVKYWKAPLLASVPARSFARGFLRHEGFHNLLISRWSKALSLEILGHWLDLVNTEGWIPREQTLGAEAQAKVPPQHDCDASPPTLFLPLHRLISDMAVSQDASDQQYLEALFPRLEAWYTWYNTTQVGSTPSSYRWRGRNASDVTQLNPLTLASGLDDYPRASHPTAEERHVDLRCWMALASGVMAQLAKSLGRTWQGYDAMYQRLMDNALLDTLHWSEEGQQYSDFGLHSDHARPETPAPPAQHPAGQPAPDVSSVRVSVSPPRYQFVNAFGYVSLFPFLLKIVDVQSPKLHKILTDLKDPDLLWTPYGLRSLAQTSSLYGKHNSAHDPVRWRGSVWIDMNYLAVAALHHYAHTAGPYSGLAREIYTDLRSHVVTNMVKEFERTGFIWERYSDTTGEGEGSHPNTGGSALLVLIMSELY